MTRIHYDRNTRISKVIRSEQYDEAADDGIGIRYLYNHQDLLLQVMERILQIRNPDGGVESYTYDSAGNITSTTDAKGGNHHLPVQQLWKTEGNH